MAKQSITSGPNIAKEVTIHQIIKHSCSTCNLTAKIILYFVARLSPNPSHSLAVLVLESKSTTSTQPVTFPKKYKLVKNQLLSEKAVVRQHDQNSPNPKIACKALINLSYAPNLAQAELGLFVLCIFCILSLSYFLVLYF